MSGIKLIVAILCLFFVYSPAWAEEAVFRHPLGPQTMDAFKTTAARFTVYPIVRGNFEQEKILSRHNRSLKSSGNFLISADMGMVWETLLPFPSTLALGKDYLVQSRPGGQKTVLSAQGNETFIRLAEVMSAVFSGDTQGLLGNFEVYYSGSVSNWELGLLPLDSVISSFAAKITMAGDSAIRSIHISEQNGDVITYLMSNHSYPADLNENEKAYFSLP